MLSPFRVFVIGLNFLPKNYEDVYDLSQKISFSDLFFNQ